MTNAQPSIDKADWNDTDAPAEGPLVQVRAQDGHGFYVLPFAVEFRDDRWFNPETGEELDCFIAAWRPLKGSPADAHDPQRLKPAGATAASIPLEDLNAENDE
jgi:hypothetical protein